MYNHTRPSDDQPKILLVSQNEELFNKVFSYNSYIM